NRKFGNGAVKRTYQKNELIEYIQNYVDDDDDKWLYIYINWCSWENINQVVCDIVLSPVEIARISCIAVSRDLIAVGTQDGRLRLYTSNWKPVYDTRLLAVKITSLTFMSGEINDQGIDITLIVSYPKGLNIFMFDGYRKNHLLIEDVKSHSIYKNYICYEKVGGRMTIAKLTKNGVNQTLREIWFSRIYSPSSLSCMKMWNGVCTFLINNEENDDEVKCDFIEFFILGCNEKYSKKMFNTWEIFRCYITCIYVYGNTLLLGVDVGVVYIYHVSCWRNLDLRKYSQKIIIGKHPIICIDVKETPTERKVLCLIKIQHTRNFGFSTKRLLILVECSSINDGVVFFGFWLGGQI
ncbi:hypothetical protein NQ317_001422, partial [Molorchus minor]